MASEIDMQASQLYCERVSKQSRSNFLLAFKFLPKQRRQALYAFYTICRELDDLVDSGEPSTNVQAQLDDWRAEIEKMYVGTATHHATFILQPLVTDYGIEKQHFLELIAGMEMDLKQNRYEHFEDLYTYCYRVASVVGMVCSRVFGCRSQQAYKFAENLGVAFQLTNIARDIDSDLERDRIYIPLADMTAAGYSIEKLKARTYDQTFVALMQEQYNRAKEFYQKAQTSLPQQEKHQLLPAMLMASYYEAILERLQKQQFRVFDKKIGLPLTYKIMMFVCYWPRVMARRLVGNI